MISKNIKLAKSSTTFVVVEIICLTNIGAFLHSLTSSLIFSKKSNGICKIITGGVIINTYFVSNLQWYMLKILSATQIRTNNKLDSLLTHTVPHICTPGWGYLANLFLFLIKTVQLKYVECIENLTLFSFEVQKNRKNVSKWCRLLTLINLLKYLDVQNIQVSMPNKNFFTYIYPATKELLLEFIEIV